MLNELEIRACDYTKKKKSIYCFNNDRFSINLCSVKVSIKSSVKVLSQPAFEITRSSSQQDIVGVPVQAKDSRANGLLNVLTNPPGKPNEQYLLYRKALENLREINPYFSTIRREGLLGIKRQHGCQHSSLNKLQYHTKSQLYTPRNLIHTVIHYVASSLWKPDCLDLQSLSNQI